MILESASEVAVGVAVEAVMFSIAVAVAYRFLAGRFLFPKREIILPNQRGVVVKGDQIVRIAEPGSCWLLPKQKVILLDMRAKPLQMLGVEVLGSDSGVLRVSLSGEFKTIDPAVYYANSANAAEALFAQLRRALLFAARQESSVSLAASPHLLGIKTEEALAPHALHLGLSVVTLDIWEAVPLGFLRSTKADGDSTEPASGLVH
jgi:hypothetical protein